MADNWLYRVHRQVERVARSQDVTHKQRQVDGIEEPN